MNYVYINCTHKEHYKVFYFSLKSVFGFTHALVTLWSVGHSIYVQYMQPPFCTNMDKPAVCLIRGNKFRRRSACTGNINWSWSSCQLWPYTSWCHKWFLLWTWLEREVFRWFSPAHTGTIVWLKFLYQSNLRHGCSIRVFVCCSNKVPFKICFHILDNIVIHQNTR